MAYNKAKAERQWFRWKEAEENELRKLGVDEDTIQRLHTYDWAQFNKERQYLQRQVELSPFVDLISAQDIELPVEDTQALLDSIENAKLLRILSKEDKLTLQIILYKLLGLHQYRDREKNWTDGNNSPAAYLRLKKVFSLISCHDPAFSGL